MKFKVGDRVRVRTKTFAGHQLKGYIGTVICVYTNDLSVGVEFDERFDIGHNCEGLGKMDIVDTEMRTSLNMLNAKQALSFPRMRFLKLSKEENEVYDELYV